MAETPEKDVFADGPGPFDDAPLGTETGSVWDESDATFNKEEKSEPEGLGMDTGSIWDEADATLKTGKTESADASLGMETGSVWDEPDAAIKKEKKPAKEEKPVVEAVPKAEEEELLTADEMAALLPDPKSDAGQSDRKKRIVPYNFRRPDRFSKDQVRSLYLLHDLFSHSLSASLPLVMRAMCEVNLISVEQQPYSEYLKGISDPTAMYLISIDQLKGAFVIEISPSIAFSTIDRMLGGAGSELKSPRPATDLELKLLEGFLASITDKYREAWKPILEIDTKVIGREARPQLLQVVPPNEVVATVLFQIQVGESRGTMSFCLPVGMLEPVIDKFSQSSYSAKKVTSPEKTRALIRVLSHVRFPVSAALDRVRASVSDLMALEVGDVLRTNHRIAKDLNVCISGKTKFTGKVAALEGRLVVTLDSSEADADSQQQMAA